MRKIYFFDLDNTLYPEHSFIFPRLSKLVTESFRISPTAQREYFAKSFFSSNYNLWVQVFCDLAGIDFDELMWNFRMLLIQQGNFPELSFHPKVKRKLSLILRQNSFGGIVTNGNPEQQRIKASSLNRKLPILDRIIYANLIAPKPNPSCLINTLDELSTGQEEFVYVGDDHVDMVFAEELGIQFISANSFFKSNIRTYGW